jgi:hypothetical protein
MDESLKIKSSSTISIYGQRYMSRGKIVKACLGPPVSANKTLYWSPIGISNAEVHIKNEFPADLRVKIFVKPLKQTNPGNSNIPQFTEREQELFKGFNVYTPSGQINEIQWRIPFQRPRSQTENTIPLSQE